MSIQQFCLRWNNHQPNFISVFTTMLNNEFLVDVTLAAEGKELHAHKIILSACSVYFQNLFLTYPKKHAIVIMKDIKYADLRIIVDFMYYGEVNVSEEQLPAILETAKVLKIKGLTEMPDTSVTKSQSMSSERADLLTPGESSWGSDTRRQSVSPCNTSPSLRRKRSASNEKPAERSCNDSNLLKNPDMKITVSVNQNQQNIKNRSKEPQFSSYHPSRESLEENGGIENINVEEGASNFMSRPLDLNVEEPSAAHLQQETKVTALAAKRSRLLIRQHRIKKGTGCVFEDDDDCESLQLTSKIVERQMSEPTPQTRSLEMSALKKQMSHPLPERTSKEGSPAATSSVSLFRKNNPEMTISDMSCESVVSCDPENILVDAELPSWTPGGSDALDFRENPNQNAGDAAHMRVRHCPVIRQGPALSCNFCWNTIDDQGRISRRKTKYHCPECGTNLCIVPCFYEYHERQSN